MVSNDDRNKLDNPSGSPDIQNQNYIIREPQNSQEHQQHKQKKKSRGNRKLQRYRRKFRKQGMDSHRISELISSEIDMEQSKTDDITQQNEQTNKPTANETIFHPPKPIKKKTKKKNKKNINEKQTIIKKKANKSNESVSIRKVKALAMANNSIDYASVPDEILRQMTSTAFNRTEKFNYFSNEDEKIKFIRHYTSLIDRLSYVQLQEFQWKYYHHIGITQNIWKGRMSKHMAEKYTICHTYGRSKTLIEQRLTQIERHLQQAHHAIQKFEDEILSKCAHNDECFSAIKELSSVIHQFVQEQQKPLQHEFEYKREILILDATDHQLVQKFFDLEPNKSHIIIARRIWQATMKQMMIEEDIALLEHRRLTSTQSQSASNLVHQMIDNIDENLKNSNEIMEISSTTCSLSNEIKRLQALKSNIIHQAILTSRGMAENFKTIIQIERNKFSLKNRFMESTSEWQKLVLDAIEIRRLYMIERTNFIIKHKLAT